MTNNTIAVLMSSYNGEKYISTQIDSILAQEGVNVELYIRDDGSSDRTVEIINQYVSKDKRVHFVPGEPLGVGRSFMTLLMMDIQADYYSFSDQDDFWYPNKLKAAVEKLESNGNKFTLYCCNQNCVDADGRYMYTRFSNDYVVPSFISQVIKNDFAGCTMVFSSDFRDEIIEKCPPLEFFVHRLHDSWLSCVAHVYGGILFDYTSYMDFRRNIGNFSDDVITQSLHRSRCNVFFKKVQRIKKRGFRQKQAVPQSALLLMEKFNDRLSEQDLAVLSKIGNYTNNVIAKIKLMTCSRFIQSIRTDRIYCYIRILFNLF